MDYSNNEIEAVLQNGNMHIDSDEVYDAVRRGWTKLHDASDDEIIEHFADYEPESIVGVVSNVKGIVFEQEIVRTLDNAGIDADLFDATNNPGTDIFLSNGQEFSVKSGISPHAAEEDLDEGLDVISTHEIATYHDEIIDTGMSSDELTDAVVDALF